MPCWSSADDRGIESRTRVRLAALPGLLLMALLLGGCARGDNPVRVLGLLPDGQAPEAVLLHVQLPERLREGLQRGVVLHWRLELETTQGRRSLHRELRYSPLSRQYQVREPASGYSRSYPSQAAALAALERWPVPTGLQLRAARLRLDTARLPAPLVLPALFDRDWRLDSGREPLAQGAHATPAPTAALATDGCQRCGRT